MEAQDSMVQGPRGGSGEDEGRGSGPTGSHVPNTDATEGQGGAKKP